MSREDLHLLCESSLDLALRDEMLPAAGEDDFGAAGRSLQESGEMVRRFRVGHPQCELVEAVEEEGDAALFQHVAELGGREAVHAFLREVLGEERVEEATFFE